MNKQSYLLVSSIVTVTFLWFVFLLTPFLTEKKIIELKITENKSQLKDFDETINILPKFIEERIALKQTKKHLNSKLYTKEEVLNLFTHLKDAASAQQIVITEITPPIEELLHLNSYIPDSTKPQFLNIGVQVTGSYIQFAKFVKTIEEESYFRGINECRLSGSKDYNQELNLYIGFKALLGRIGDES